MDHNLFIHIPNDDISVVFDDGKGACEGIAKQAVESHRA